MKKFLLFLLICGWLLTTALLLLLKVASVAPVAHWNWSAVTAPIWLAWVAAVMHGCYRYNQHRAQYRAH